jgi:hypothetical protein
MNIWTGIFAFVSVVILLGAFYYLGSTTSELNKRINELEEENQELDRLNSLYQHQIFNYKVIHSIIYTQRF